MPCIAAGDDNGKIHRPDGHMDPVLPLQEEHAMNVMARILLATGVALGTAPGTFAESMPGAAAAVVPVPPKPVALRFAIIKTSQAHGTEGLIWAGGDPFKPIALNHSAVIVQHPKGTFLLDTGLGRQIDSQFGADMPWWGKPLFAYTKVSPVKDQLAAAGVPVPPRIFLTHTHWDHASGLADFPETEVWTPAAERAFATAPKAKSIFRSQFGSAPIRWHDYVLAPKPFAGYATSFDVFGDGSAVLVGMPGHTPGSVGLFLQPASGKRYFFAGDVVWSVEAARLGKGKFWLSGLIVDNDGAATLQGIGQLRQVIRDNPDLVVVPAHDAGVQDTIGYFPEWRQ